jgi:ABC-type dipeptide/oligopeptide/nickel transport system ATPase component
VAAGLCDERNFLGISASLPALLLLQETLRQEFADRTLLAVAHRLHTIIEADRVLVMQQGSAVEYGAPAALLKDDAGHFTGTHKSQMHTMKCTATVMAETRPAARTEC